MRKINLIVLHCSATRETAEYTPEQLERDHRAPGIPLLPVTTITSAVRER